MIVRAPFAAVAVALVAVVLVAIVLLWEADSNETSTAFISTPEFVLWMLLLCAQAAVWGVAFTYIWNVVRRRQREVTDNEDHKIGTTVLIWCLAVALILLSIGFSALPDVDLGPITTDLRHLPHGAEFPLSHDWRLWPLVGIAFCIGVLAVVGMWFTAVRFGQLKAEGDPERDSVTDLTSYLSLRDDLLSLLTIAGVIIGLGTLSAGALREAVLATNNEPVLATAIAKNPGAALEFAPEYVLAYGLFFTGLLAIAFGPCFVAMRNTGAWLRDRAYPLKAPTHEKFADNNINRKALDDLLQTNLSASGTFKAGVAILTPLAGSLVTLVLPT